MGRFDDAADRLNQQQRNPAAPSGLQQSAGQQQAERGRFSDAGKLQQWAPTSYVDEAQSWYTGRNTEDTRSGWDNAFAKSFHDNWNAALEAGTAADYFRNGGTGVVTWDHEGDDGEQFAFGDVVEDGKKVGNVYEDFDTDTGNLMMLPWLTDGTTQRRLWEDAPGEKEVSRRVEEFVSGKRAENDANLEKALGAMAFQGDVDATREGLQAGSGDEWLAGGGGALGGAATGAATGAALTAWLGPGAAVGATVGGIAGAIAGGVGGLMNKDEIAEAAARSYEMTELAGQEYGPAAAFAKGVEGLAGMGMKLTSPLQNLTRGATDAIKGDVGDGVSERYRVDEKGESTTGLGYKVADWVSLVGDSLMQFASPLSRAIYTAEMTGVIAGETGALAFTGGKMFDPREGGYDNIFVDDDGNADPVSALAGIGKIAIDAVQLGGLRGLARQSQAAGAAAAAGERQAELAGHRFLLDEVGNVTGVKRTMALLAPSEQIAWASAARSARVAAMKDGRAVSADDFYRAANSLANGSSKLKTAVVNAFGEGYEEAAQAILEPVAVDGDLDGWQVASAFAQGAGAGLGMSTGATVQAPENDARLRAQAYVVETLRRGEEPGWDNWTREWKTLSQAEKRVRATRTPADAEATRAAQQVIARDHATTRVATDLDAAKALDSQRKAIESDLKSATTRTDQYIVMGGLVDVGRVDDQGNLRGDTAPAEAVEASARTIHQLLANRLEGFGIQEEFLANRLATLDPADPKHAETLELLAQVSAGRLYGEGLVEDLGKFVEKIYDPATTAAQAEALTQRMNGLLRAVFEKRAPLNPVEGVDDAVLPDAAAQFVSLIQSREPKLDAGSYLALLPRASWQLTQEGSDNFLQVNTDIIAAINGDFDGDKLRAENQIVLSPERFVQARAGQFFAGAGRELDIATRNFDEALSVAVAKGLTQPKGPLRTEADATMEAIRKAIIGRYGPLMSPEAQSRVWQEFSTAVLAGSADARVTLLNALAREAGEAISNLGRNGLRNEWLWASKVVRANFNAYQTEYRRLRNFDENGNQINAASAEIPVEDFDTPEGTQIRKQRASTDAQSLALFGAGNTLFRKFQKIHYTWFNSSVLGAEQATRPDLFEMARMYEELGQGVTLPELQRTGTDDTVAARVLVMLSRLVDSALETPEMARFSPAAAMTILANVKVKDVWFDALGPVQGQGNLTLVQVLLKRALDADREANKRIFDFDEKLQAKHARLRALTVPNSVADDVNAERAFLEVFKAVPFGDSLGGNTGALGVHTTPEQWLRTYLAGDADARQDLERFYTNVPEYLDRKERSNIPYSMDEMSRGEITPYRSMLDAMMAVGRSELTFDPTKDADKAFGGRLADTDRRAREDFRQLHGQVQDALRSFRQIRNRSTATREQGSRLVQEMLNANPQQGRAILDLVPNAAANALYEYRDNQLYVAPWLYDVLAEENSEVALLQYWKNLTLAKWNAQQVEGRRYDSLNSRFDRLLYHLAKEPGQLHLELMIRRLDQAKNLDEFFVWLNTTPGLVPAGHAPLLPFVDDVADFEGAAEGGGWVTVKAGSDLRTAITGARTAAEQLNRTMAFREAKMATDRNILDAIKDARAGDPDPLKQEYLRKLEKAVSIARELPRGFAPSAMLALTRGVVRSFDAGSHEKGKTASSYKELGEFQALMDAFAFVPGLERAMEVLTAHSVGSLRSNVGDLAKHGGAAMDANGREITWEPMTVDQAIEMLDDPRTAPLAHMLLTPAALDITPVGLTERLLMEASLKDLLDNDHYKELFRTDADNQLDIDTRYLSMLDMKARAEGGHFDAVRIANDYAVVLTSGLGKRATPEKEDELTARAYHHVARILRMVGEVQATPGMRNADTLAKLRTAALKELRALRSSRALPGFTDRTSGQVVEDWIKDMVANLELELEEAQDALVGQYTGDELTRRSEALDAAFEQNKRRIEAMLDDNALQTAVARFELTGDPVADQGQYARITEYVTSMANFPMRAAEATEAWTKLAEQRRAGLTPDLSVEEWDTLSRAAIGLTLVDDTLRVATHISVPSLVEGLSSGRFYKYFDPSYSFLVTDLLDENSPLTKAAVWLHTAAEQPRQMRSVKTLTRTLEATVLDREQYGTWTPGLMAQLVEGQQRMDSAGAPPGIAAAGNGPKRWAAVAAATKRTGAVPPAELLTTVSFTADFLDEAADPFNQISVQPKGAAEPTSMPVALLENRFFADIRIGGQSIPLDQDNLGFAWDGADEKNPYRYVSLERLRPYVQRYLQVHGLPADTPVEADFFHPDSAPAGVWNNAFFEGMSHSLLPDGSESLVATLWSDNGGRISADTQWTIDAGKKGKRAIMPFRRDQLATALAEADTLWTASNDFAGMLRRKTEAAVRYDDGSNPAGVAAYNAMFKIMKLQHIVVGYDADGNPAALTADEVIAHQAANGKAAPLPLDQAKLVKISPDVLRTMLGETGDQGVARFFDDEYLLNPDLIRAYEGIDGRALARFGAGWLREAGSLADTTLANIGQQRVLTVRTVRPAKERNARAERKVYLDRRANEARAARYGRLKDGDARRSYAVILQTAKAAVGSERTPFDFGATNSGVIGPKDLIEAQHTERLLEAFTRVQEAKGLERGWMVTDDGPPDYSSGTLTLESLHDDRDAENWVVKDDLALVNLLSFKKPERDHEAVMARVIPALDFLTDSGAYVVLGSGDGTGDVRFEAAQYLESRGYVQIMGSRHLYGPAEFVYQSQNERAYESTLAETGLIRPAHQAITFLAIDPIETDENDAILNPASVKLRDRKLLGNLVPSSAFPHFNVPVEDNRDAGLYARTLAHLRTMTDPTETTHRAALLKMAGADPAGAMGIEEALDRFHSKITNRSSLEPVVGEEIRVGDIIPFVHVDGKVLLYRHGMKLPRPRDLDALFAENGMNVALAKSQTEPAATANSGRIRNIEDRTGYGKRLVLEVPLQPHGNKVQLEWNGMKYIVVPKPDSFGDIPQVFRNGTVVDLISDVASADSKEAFEGRVVGYRNALAFFQFDFTDDLVQFFFPGTKPGDPDYAEQSMLTYDLLWRLANQDEYRIPFRDASALAKANVRVAELLGDFAAQEATLSKADPSWADRLQDTTEPSALIARAMITYLLTPGANVDNVLKSAGFSHPRAGDPIVETRQVPGLFADLLDFGLDSPLHAELIRRFDGQLMRGPNGAGFKLHPDWTVEMFDGSGGSRRGYLQFGEAHSSGDNPVLDGQAFDATEAAAVSPHNAMAANLSIGAITAHSDLEKSKAFARSFTREGDVSKFGADGDSVWHMLTALPNEEDLKLSGWRRETPAENVRRVLAREELVGFYQPLNTESWNEDTNEEGVYHQAALRILDRLNLHGSQRAMIDTWVRDHLGRPHGLDEHGNDLSVIPFDDAMQVLADIERNIKKGLPPHAGANLPLVDVNHWTTLYLANLNLPDSKRWKLMDNGVEVTSWDGWVEMAFGTAWIVPEGGTGVGPEPDFHLMYQLAIDGRMHGYQGATSHTRYLPVSTDILRQRLLMDEKTNRMLVSISADENLLATDPTLWAASGAELEDILAGQRIYPPGRGGPDPASAKGRQRARVAAWHKDTGAPRQVNKKMRGVRAEGQAFIGYTTHTSAFFRSMMNLRVGNTLFNLALMVSAPLEAWTRRSLNLVANAATGEATGATGKMQARLTEAADRVTLNEKSGKTLGDLLSALGIRTTYTSDQMRRIDTLVKALSTLPEFKAMVYKELAYQYPSMPGIGRVEKWLERYAKFGAKLQDPAWGMPPQDLARTYLEAVLKKNASDPTGENVYSIERMLTELPRDPQWLKSQDREAHNLGIASVANVRSVKPNVFSLGFRGFVEPLSENPKFVVNSAGNMLKVLTAFQNFWANFGTNITGMQGPVDFMAFMLDGRKKKLTGRMQAALRGVPYVADEAEYFDMSEALESIDLADAFIKSGVTHSALFALGMMAGGLGLSGEDDEMKWRRRQAELQGVPVLYDPRDLAADFRNKDSIYLNWLPFGMDSWFRKNPDDPNSDALAQMNWVTRTFLSPIIGFERFYETGDFSEVLYGFKDAVGSHPIVNATLWNSASDTAAYLHEQANDAAEKGDEVEASHLLMSAVGVLERMLFENSMVNMVYIGMDEWDRDPYVLPLTDSDGVLQRDIEGNARPNDLAMTTFINDQGELQQGYLSRSQLQADRRVLTENRATLALVSALFTGGLDDSDLWRYNMPIKTRTIDKPEISQDEAELLLKALAAQMPLGNGPNVTAEELLPQVRNEMYARGDRTGQFFTEDQVWKAAEAEAKRRGALALSFLDDMGNEQLTHRGARAIFEGIRAGTFDLNDPAQAAQIAIPYEMREQIAAEWSKELVQEGIDLGLDKTKATSRMKRIMGGPLDMPEVDGLGDLLWDKRISYDTTVTYGQLNTSYVMGPDGRPWASGFKRDGLLGALGIMPLKGMIRPEGGATALDERGNVMDLVNGMNTGLRAVVPFDDSRNVPTDKEIGDLIAKAIKDAANSSYTPFPPFEKKDGGGSGWQNFGSGWRNYGGGGYGGYGGGGSGAFFTRMYPLPRGTVPYGNSTPFINSSNPYVRRASIRRERVWSERGRLKQWQ